MLFLIGTISRNRLLPVSRTGTFYRCFITGPLWFPYSTHRKLQHSLVHLKQQSMYPHFPYQWSDRAEMRQGCRLHRKSSPQNSFKRLGPPQMGGTRFRGEVNQFAAMRHIDWWEQKHDVEAGFADVSSVDYIWSKYFIHPSKNVLLPLFEN